MTITNKMFLEIFPNSSKGKSPALLRQLVISMNNTGLSTVNRLAGFIAQCGHESGEFQYNVENLNYSSTALLKVFGKYFPTPELAEEYARIPWKIANRVYANRMGNGDEESGDGWKYRGRGYIQLTGKNNYVACGDSLGIDLLGTPSLLQTPEYSVLSALWYWNKNNLNRYADADDIKGMTKAINGGYHGLDKRTAYYEKAKLIIRESFDGNPIE